MILTYAVATAADAMSLSAPAPRVRARGGMAVLYEHVESPPDRTTEHVLAFGRTLHSIWSQIPVLPMQFGCTTDTEEDLDRWLDEHGESWSARLATLAGQAEVILHVPSSPAVLTPVGASAQHSSGRDYLLTRARALAEQDAIADDVGALFAPWTQHWRTLPGLGEAEHRFTFLVPRESVPEVRVAVTEWSRDRPGVQLSGPWPPFSFCEEVVP